MGVSPAVVIVVRHGARMDAADNQWHLTSPTPYDPPLTYGGWNQSKALGARIASILRTRETDDELLSPLGPDQQGGNKRKRRHKVVIHSSPFLRCIQTSVAISAGLAQNPGHTLTHPHPSTSHSPMHSSPRVKATTLAGSPSLAPISEPVLSVITKGPPAVKRSIIRVDAFLGEWMNPEYFEQITPPPSSNMMIAGAKADLLRKEDYSYLTGQKITQNQGFPGGWGSPIVSDRDDDLSLSSLSSLAQALPNRDRTSSLGNAGSNGTATHNRARSPNPIGVPAYAEHGIYKPPIPSYAISSTDPIPLGYYAHARDACVDVDYQWDSMREPQLWGTGGEYGEEWSSMHRRFRKGLEKMIAWYNEADDPASLMAKTPLTPAFPADTEDLDEDTDLVLVLVSHGAGCNALIGALTNQPVLLDVGMSSLTMAVHKSTIARSPTTTPGHSRTNSMNLSNNYDVPLIANTDHLRSTVGTPSQSRNASTAGLPLFRERSGFGSESGSFDATKLVRTGSSSGNFGSIRRAASVANPGPRNYVMSMQPSIGLWSPSLPKQDKVEVTEVAPLDINSNETTENSPPPRDDTPVHSAPGGWNPVTSDLMPTPENEDVVAPLGLWGGSKPDRSSTSGMLSSPKRRWTVNERT